MPRYEYQVGFYVDAVDADAAYAQACRVLAIACLIDPEGDAELEGFGEVVYDPTPRTDPPIEDNRTEHDWTL